MINMRTAQVIYFLDDVMDFNMAVVTESKYNLMIFFTLAKRAITRQRQDYWSNILYANAPENFTRVSKTSPSQTNAQ